MIASCACFKELFSLCLFLRRVPGTTTGDWFESLSCDSEHEGGDAGTPHIVHQDHGVIAYEME